MLKTTKYELISSSISGLLVLMLFNSFIIPLDKVLLPLFVFVLLFTSNWKISKNLFVVIFILIGYVGLVTIFNFGSNDVLVFYPLLFIIAGFLAGNNGYITASNIQFALFINIIFGLTMVIAAYAGFNNSYVQSLVSKGIPFLLTSSGMSPTSQVYSTCCILWVIIAFESEKYNKFQFFLVLLALVMTFNRSSLLFMLLLLFLYRRKVFFFVSSGFVILSILFFDIIQMVIFSSSTLNSRVQLRYGAELSYWNTDDLMVLFFGRGNHQTTEGIAQQTIWGRTFIENGLDFIAHSYGIFGLSIYVTALAIVQYFLIKHKQYKLAIFTLYYFTITQYLTNEFLASTLMFFVMTTILIYRSKQRTQTI